MIRHAVLCLVLVSVPLQLAAHAKSEGTTPTDGATVTEVPEVLMRFDDPVRIVSVTLTSSDGDVDIERETGLDPAIEFRAIPAEDLAPGQYRFEWRGLAADGHPMQGSFSFTVAE